LSEENLELIRRAYELMNRGDIEAGMELADPAIELETLFTAISGRRYLGHDGVREWWADQTESWEQMRQTPQQVIEVDAERAIVVVRLEATGKASGVEIDQEVAATWTIRNGKCVRLEAHGSLEEALEAASAKK
jgi:ketosteroid isomerase-like protein